MRVENVYLAGIGTAATSLVPSAVAVDRGWWSHEEAETAGVLSVSVAGDTPAPDLAVEAALAALEMAGVAASEIGGVFHGSVHPQGPEGWSAPHYVNLRTVRQPVTSAEIRNGCLAFLTALHLTSALLGSGERSALLLTCADNFGTAAVDRWRASRLFVLADGGGAVVLSRRGGFARVLAVGAGSAPALEERHRSGEQMFPPGLTVGAPLNFEARTEHHRRAVMARPDRRQPDFGAVLIEVVERTLKEAAVTMEEVTRVVHDGFNRDSLQFGILDPLGIEDERTIWDFTSRVGHAGPVDQIRGLEHCWRQGLVGAGELVLMVTDAPGMEAGCAVLRIERGA